MQHKKYRVFALFILVTQLSVCQNEYSYDQNGNLIKDGNKNIMYITYNVLNLPEEVHFSDGRKIINTYTVSGKKINQETFSSDGTLHSKKDYLNNIVYNSGQLEYINTAEGYIEPENNDFLYTYQHKDHLGNIRTSFPENNDNATLVKEEKNYYPFGLQWKQSNTVIRGRKHNYGFGGKEEQVVFNLDWHDFEARMYDTSLGRWHVVDPMAEKFSFISPYVYVANNPIKYIDPDGRQQRVAPPPASTIKAAKQVAQTTQKISRIPYVGPIIAAILIPAGVGIAASQAAGRPLPAETPQPNSVSGSISLAAGVSYPFALSRAKKADARKAKKAAQENQTANPELSVIQGGGGDDGDGFKTAFVVTSRGDYTVTRNTIDFPGNIIVGDPSLAEARNTAIRKRKEHNRDTFILQVDATHWRQVTAKEYPDNPSVFVSLKGNIRINEILQVKEMGQWDIPTQSTINAMQ